MVKVLYYIQRYIEVLAYMFLKKYKKSKGYFLFLYSYCEQKKKKITQKEMWITEQFF